MLALILTAILAFALVAAGTVLVARRIALSTALAEAMRSARTMGKVVFAPTMARVLAGDQAAIAQLDSAVGTRRVGGALVRVKVWSRDGTVLYSDDHALIGRRFEHNSEVQAAVTSGQAHTGVSTLDDIDNVRETGSFKNLVEAYVPLVLDDGKVLAFEVYSTDERVTEAERDLTADLVPFSVLALLVLLVLQLPVAVWLINQMHRSQQERAQLLTNLLLTSGRERRRIAEELHDGVVQNLAGSGYALGSALRRLPGDVDPQARTTLNRVLDNVQQSVLDLRNLIVDVRPSDLTASGLIAAITVQAERARASGIDVHVDASLRTDPDPGIAATIYRGAREGIVNVLKHAQASNIDIRIAQQGQRVRLEVLDDGSAAPARAYAEAPEGHVGLALLHSAAEDVGGTLRVSPRAGGGTAFVLDVPLRPHGAA